jgi:hypothetical protein
LLYIPSSGEEFTEKELYEKFQVRNGGGIRPTRKNKAIILIKSFFAALQGGYKDGIDEKSGIIYWVGEGEENQRLVRNNKSIYESKQNGYKLLYFEKHGPNRLVFRFPVEYVSWSYDKQFNSRGRERQIIVFKLKIIR